MRSDREKRHSTYKTPSIYLMANFSRQYFQTPPCCMHSRGICEGICEMHFLEKWRWPIHFRDCKSVHVTNEICRFWGCIFGGYIKVHMGQRRETLDLPYLTLLCDNLKNRMFLQNFQVKNGCFIRIHPFLTWKSYLSGPKEFVWL
jgi:hypothetical protein